jgi:hypothetical protein
LFLVLLFSFFLLLLKRDAVTEKHFRREAINIQTNRKACCHTVSPPPTVVFLFVALDLLTLLHILSFSRTDWFE